MTVRDRRGLVSVGTFSAKSAYVGTCSAMSAKCRDLFSEGALMSGRVLLGRVSVGTCMAMSAYCRDLFGKVGLMSVRVRRGRLCVGT